MVYSHIPWDMLMIVSHHACIIVPSPSYVSIHHHRSWYILMIACHHACFTYTSTYLDPCLLSVIMHASLFLLLYDTFLWFAIIMDASFSPASYICKNMPLKTYIFLWSSYVHASSLPPSMCKHIPSYTMIHSYDYQPRVTIHLNMAEHMPISL